jgi:hypothetical protein
MLAGPLPGIYDPTGTGRILFAFFAAMAETERENIRGNWSGPGGRRGGLILSSGVLMISQCLRRRRLWSCWSGFRSGMR